MIASLFLAATLTWDALPTNCGVVGYNIHYGPIAASPINHVSVGNVTTAVVQATGSQLLHGDRTQLRRQEQQADEPGALRAGQLPRLARQQPRRLPSSPLPSPGMRSRTQRNTGSTRTMCRLQSRREPLTVWRAR